MSQSHVFLTLEDRKGIPRGSDTDGHTLPYPPQIKLSSVTPKLTNRDTTVRHRGCKTLCLSALLHHYLKESARYLNSKMLLKPVMLNVVRTVSFIFVT